MVSLQSTALQSQLNNQHNWSDLCRERASTCHHQAYLNMHKLSMQQILQQGSLPEDSGWLWHSWEWIHIDCCNPWSIHYQNNGTGNVSKFKIHLLLMVDACIGWSKFSWISLPYQSPWPKPWTKNGFAYTHARKSVVCMTMETILLGSNFKCYKPIWHKAKAHNNHNPTANAIM